MELHRFVYGGFLLVLKKSESSYVPNVYNRLRVQYGPIQSPLAMLKAAIFILAAPGSSESVG